LTLRWQRVITAAAMAEIVAIHGILNEFLGPSTLERDWTPAIHDGLWLAGYTRSR